MFGSMLEEGLALTALSLDWLWVEVQPLAHLVAARLLVRLALVPQRQGVPVD
jgi:hypothetical protein